MLLPIYMSAEHPGSIYVSKLSAEIGQDKALHI